MTKRVLCFITDGSEELETVGVIDLLRRAQVRYSFFCFVYLRLILLSDKIFQKLQVTLCGVQLNEAHNGLVQCSRHIMIKPDVILEEAFVQLMQYIRCETSEDIAMR